MIIKYTLGLVGLHCILATAGSSATEFLGARTFTRFIPRCVSSSLIQPYADCVQKRFASSNRNSPLLTSSYFVQGKFTSSQGGSDKSLFTLMLPSFEEVDGNCLKEIAAYGSPDFVTKSYRLMHMLKTSFKDEYPVEGKEGLSDAEADWKASWEMLSPDQKRELQGAYKKIFSIVVVADKVFYGIDE